MDFPIWIWVLIGIGSTLFVTLTWLPVGGLFTKLFDNLDPHETLFGTRYARLSSPGDIWYGYYGIALFLVVWSVYLFAWIGIMIICAVVKLYDLSFQLGEKLGGWKNES